MSYEKLVLDRGRDDTICELREKCREKTFRRSLKVSRAQ